MKSTKKQIIIVFAILTMALVLSCAFVACDKTDTPDAPKKEFTITFDTQGGSEVKPITIAEGATITLPRNPTKEGYIFDGWYLSDEFIEEFNATQTISSNITVYAKWIEDNGQEEPPVGKTYSITFMVDGGTYKTLNISEGSVITLPENPEKKCCIFEGWYIDEDLLEQFNATQDISQDIVVYAKWSDNHTVVEDSEVLATCTTAGLTAGKHCSVCGEVLQAQNEIPALGHDFSKEWTIDKEATCTEKGSKSHHCTRCEVKSDVTEIPTIEHSESDWIIDKEATCTEDGSKHTECTVCHTTIKTENISALGHTGGKATCTEQAICERCGNKYGESLEHDYEPIVTDPTCTKQGYTTHTCTHCKHSYKDTYIDALGHKENIDEAVEPTCTTAGLTAGKHCSVCGEVLQAQNEIPALGHDFSKEWTIDKEATCTEKGSKSHHCTRCEVKSDETEIPTIEHSESDWIIDKEATCTEGGSKHTECTVCHTMIKTEIPALGHDFSKEWTIDKEATCTEKGSKSHHCTRCEVKSDETEIPTKEHSESNWIIDKEATCTEGGSKHTECTVCHTTIKTENISALGHTGGTATCTEQATCSVCGEKYGDALGHKYGDIIPKTEPTCSQKGVDAHYKCSVCNKVFKNDEHKTETTLDELTIAINPNAHNFGNWIKNEGADTHTRVCSYNSKHTKTENCQGGTATCTEQAVCEKCNAKYGELANHEYENGVCIVCGSRRQSEGLTYSLNSDGNDYTVTGIGTCTDKELIIPSEYNAKPVTSIGNEAFSRCTGLMSVTIPDSVTSIGENAFDGCYRLVEVYNKSTLSITVGSSSNGYVAYYAKNVYTNEGESKLTTDENGYVIYTDGYEKILVAYHGTNTELALPSYITKINQYAFYNCTGLTSITIPDSVTSIGFWAFRGCTGLTSVTIPDRVTSIGSGTFSGCTRLTSITIPDGVTSIGSDAFYGCTGLTNITIPDSVTSIGSWAFRGCTGLTSVTIPDRVTSIGSGTFSGCTNLTSITIPYSVTSIGSTAFYNCTGLTSVTIPNSVTSIESNAFFYCTGLTSIKFNGTIEQWNAISKGNYWNYSVPATQVSCTDGPISIE